MAAPPNALTSIKVFQSREPIHPCYLGHCCVDAFNRYKRNQLKPGYIGPRFFRSNLFVG